ncbi:membrane-targeted effector domain-containing toxin [Pseudomonas fluorescens]|uniref:membrane-targeted effector domain-containing toxin n=1 Tax=Pseudomonas fluorescens TaxID=294 RepID=UPI00177B2FF6|nr:membrane-targeted effector domain-containing toxin [Pseudomonas fluorescens]MBD8192476.1 membrane-targeted effector domain-containing toxin [Pseudomonas fluorescens]MBD8227475.1 membrane-targeted effector domain-containing toxin [Pseudomonas fluorescens]MBD8785441.1 membrane-targeted effector domain-containing toxin [Pseudomonas fluorescens]MBD8817670.1 membrane-targeted effector domain-containing toxin [Pseudomonas fluorescens]
MSTADVTPPSYDAIKGDIANIARHLLKVELPRIGQKSSASLAFLEQLNTTLISANRVFFKNSRAAFEALASADLHTDDGRRVLDALKRELAQRLSDLEARDLISNQSRKTFMTYTAGFTALEHQAKLGVEDRLLHRDDFKDVQRLSLGPQLRPAAWALTFQYQEHTVELAGAFIISLPFVAPVNDLATSALPGRVLLFTPVRGLEAFDSLGELNAHLLHVNEFSQLLPARYQHLPTVAIWPLALSPISDKPLFEHSYDSLLEKRRQDIEWTLNTADNPANSATQLMQRLERALQQTLPDLTAYLELRAQALLERHLRLSAPDWYRSASVTRRQLLAEHLASYNEARQNLLDLFGPAAAPHALARYQLLERLSDDLDIHDLDPQQLHISTRRHVANVGEYDDHKNLVELALRGLHTHDEEPGSAFLTNTRLTYAGEPFEDDYGSLTPAYLVEVLTQLQPRLDFANVQKSIQQQPPLKTAIERMLDQRIQALAYLATLQGHINDDDYRLVQRLREGNDAQLEASSVSFHGAQLRDLWVLRQRDANGSIQRLLLCTPDAPSGMQWQRFNKEVDLQAHILGWCLHNGAPGMSEYVLQQVPLRFQPKLKQLLTGLRFKPAAKEHEEITFNAPCNHAQCLTIMAGHLLSRRIDDYDYATPAWYRSTTADLRKKLATQADDAVGAQALYQADTRSEAHVPAFETYVHQQAKAQLNRLLGRAQNDIDPDTVWAYAPPELFVKPSAPISYTQLFRDGHADGIGFINEQFSRSARFKGPPGLDLSALSPEQVARSVTGVWIGERYINLVKSQLLDETQADYHYRRNATLAITQLQLRNAALESRLLGDIAGVDLDWLERSIDAMGDTSASARSTYPIHRLMIDGDWVIGCYLFSHADNPVLLYTPQAPDGISFREARQFNYLLKKTKGMPGYLMERVGLQSQIRVRTFLQRAADNLPEHIDSTSRSTAFYDSIHALPGVPDLRRLLYNMNIQRKIDNVNATTVSRTQMISGILWTCVELLTAIATAPFPVVSLSVGALLAFKDGMLALHAYNQGDPGAALGHYIGFVLNTAGALATDLRPALGLLAKASRPLRQVARTAEQRQAMQLIEQLDPPPLTPATMQPVIHEGQLLWAPKTPDPIGRYLLYRADPTSGRLVSTSRLAAPDADGRWVRTGVKGGAPGPKYEKVPEPLQPLDPYEIPKKHLPEFELILNPESVKRFLRQQADYAERTRFSLALLNQPAYEAYQKQVANLANDAKNFFTYLDIPPPRADVLALEASTPHRTLIKQLVGENKGLVIGEIPSSIASKKFLIDNLDAFVGQNIKRLYLEYIPGDVFAPKLAKLTPGRSSMHLDRHLNTLDETFGFNRHSHYSYAMLIKTARKKGIAIKALDATTSYKLDDALMFGDTPPTTPRTNDLRNFYSHKVIEADIAAHPDDGWIALVHQTRMSTFNQIPGMADLQKTIALRIEDVGPNQPVGIWADTAGGIPEDALAKADYRLTMRTSYKGITTAGPSTSPVSPSTSVLAKFDLPPEFHDRVLQMIRHPDGLDTRYVPSDAEGRRAISAFKETRLRLQDHAQTYFKNRTATARSALPEIKPDTSADTFIRQIFKRDAAGLVIGEVHSDQSSKAFLIKHMSTFEQLGVKTLYFEHLPSDLFQRDLDTFFKTALLNRKLEQYLAALNRGHMLGYEGGSHFTAVIEKANKHGIRIKALDCTASYYLKGLVDSEGLNRNTLFSFYASQVIEADQAAQGAHKWVAFVGNAHTNTNKGVPGLVELHDAVSLYVRDVAPSPPTGIHADTWEINTGLKPGAARSDFTLKVGVEGRRSSPFFTTADRSRLSRPGYFMIENPSSTEMNLLHHSSSGEIVSTPIQIDDNGLFFIDRWHLKDKRFISPKTLESALRFEVNLTPAP